MQIGNPLPDLHGYKIIAENMTTIASKLVQKNKIELP